MSRRTLALGACCSFLTGIGLTALAAWVQLQYENHRETHNLFTLEDRIEGLEGDLLAARDEAHFGKYHVEALLREPDVSASDHRTDLREARLWFDRMREID